MGKFFNGVLSALHGTYKILPSSGVKKGVSGFFRVWEAKKVLQQPNGKLLRIL
jgi:hypothetical protein